MKYTITKRNQIKNISDWFMFAPPKGGDKQWKTGRSAFEMARFATSPEFSNLIEGLLNEVGVKKSQTFNCEPEAETCFPSDRMGTGGPRNHDLLMVSKDCVIGIEAKVSESFDKTIGEKRKDAGDNMNKRLNGAVEYLFGDKVPQNVEELRYQLFSATIGTLEEAKKYNLKTAIVLVLVFTGEVEREKNYEDNISRNNKDFEAFCKAVGVGPDGSVNVAAAEGIKCYLKKVEVNISKFDF